MQMRMAAASLLAPTKFAKQPTTFAASNWALE
jgi:hypothetical protein